MPIGGKLVLKGGVSLKGKVHKKKSSSKKHAQPAAEEGGGAEQQPEEQQQDGAGVTKLAPGAISVQTGKTYEEEFDLEQQRMKKPQTKSTPWGSSYRAAPEILHGYDRKVTGATASERLDMRAATKADKFCK